MATSVRRITWNCTWKTPPEKLHLKLVYKILAGIDPAGHLTWLLTAAVGSLKHKPRKPHFPLNTHFTNYFVSIGAKWAHRFKKTLLWSHSILTHNGWLAPYFPSDQNSAGWLSVSPTTNHQQSHRLINFGTPSVSRAEATWETVIAHHYCVNTIINILQYIAVYYSILQYIATWETVIAHYCVNTIINIAATILTIILLVQPGPLSLRISYIIFIERAG